MSRKAIEIGWLWFKRTVIYRDGQKIGSYTRKENVLYVNFKDKNTTNKPKEYADNLYNFKRKIK